MYFVARVSGLLILTLAFGASWVLGEEPSASSASLAFERVIGGPRLDRGVFVGPTRDGGVIVVGVTTNADRGDEDIYLVKTNHVGEVEWSKSLGGDADDNGWSVHETADGFVLAGFTQSLGSGGWDFYLIKTDPAGEEIWSKTYGGAGDDRCWALAPTPDRGFVLAGETRDADGGERDFFVVKTDARGDEVWSRRYGGDKGDRCFSLALADDGGYVLAGQTYSEGAGDRDAYIVKIDADGEFEWSKTFGGEASDVAHSIVRTSDGSFVVTGYTTSFAPQGDDPYLIKIDARGETAWTRVLPLDGVNHTITGAEALDGSFYLVGFSEYPNTGVKAGLLIKARPSGEIVWSRDILPTSIGQTFGYTVNATPDGGCVFTGHTTVGSAGDLDLLLVRVAGDDGSVDLTPAVD